MDIILWSETQFGLNQSEPAMQNKCMHLLNPGGDLAGNNNFMVGQPFAFAATFA